MHDSSDMTFRGDVRTEAQWDVFFIRKPYGDNVYDRMDDICKLRYLACNGSRSAALFLKDSYDYRKDPDQKLKYACYAALAGDRDSYDWIKERGRNLERFYPEDVVFRGPLEHGKYHGYLAVPFSRSMPLLEGKTPTCTPIEVRDADLILRCYPYSYIAPPYHHGSWPWIGDSLPEDAGTVENRSEPSEVPGFDVWTLLDSYDRGFSKAVFLYFGIGMERDEDAAIRSLLRYAEEKYPLAMEMIAYAIGYERDTMRIRMPTDRSYDTSDPMPYAVPNCARIEDSPEWNLLAMLARVESDGFCYDTEHENPEGGYEDDVLYIRPYDECRYGEPTFVFKPSGYSMAWYKHPWRDPVQSEDLTVGEIRKVMRLCIEHLTYGRGIPEGTTKELISLPMHLYEPPDEGISAALADMAKKAPCNLLVLESAVNVQTFDYRNAEEAERMALEVIARIGAHERT